MIEQHKTYLKLILRDGNIHPSQDTVVAAFVYDHNTKHKTYYNFDHPDLVKNSTLKKVVQSLQNAKVFVLNKKRHKYFLKNVNLFDVNLFQFFKDGNIFEPKKHIFSDQIKMMHHRINNAGIITPYAVHQKEFDLEIEAVQDSLDSKTDTYCYKFFNEVVSDTLFEVERNGLHVDKPLFKSYFPNAKVVCKDHDGSDDTVYTEYHIYNPTGRPSNKFDGVNYVALNKTDGCRGSFTSRYANGRLLMVDFTGFHPYIVANLIGYKVPDDETVYEHLAKQYYGVNSVSKELLAKSKKLTMVNLYGQIPKQYIHIPYFEQTEKLKDKYWEVFVEKGYVKTPIYKRKITANHIVDPNKNKLFAYIIQATETEYGLNSLSNCLKYSTGKQIKPILYIYDSILFDIGEDVAQSEIDDIVNIIRGNRFKVKVYVGNSYNDLKLV